MPEAPNKRPLNMRLDAGLMETFEAEARQLGRTNSEHGRAIIADHLEGRSIERVLRAMPRHELELAFRQDGLRRAVRTVAQRLLR